MRALGGAGLSPIGVPDSVRRGNGGLPRKKIVGDLAGHAFVAWRTSMGIGRGREGVGDGGVADRGAFALFGVVEVKSWVY